MKPEGHAETVRFLTYAWEAEKQHRDLLEQLLSGTGFFFGTLTRRIEGTPMAFLVCATCGSTVAKRPAERCPICGGCDGDRITASFGNKRQTDEWWSVASAT